MAIDLDTDDILTSSIEGQRDQIRLFHRIMGLMQGRMQTTGGQVRDALVLSRDFLLNDLDGPPSIIHKSWLDIYGDSTDTTQMGADDRFGFLSPDLTLRPFILILRGGSRPFMQAGLSAYGEYPGDTLPPLNNQIGRHPAGITGAKPTQDFIDRHNNYEHVNRFFNVMWAWRETAYFEGTEYRSADQYSSDFMRRARYFAEPVQAALSTDVLQSWVDFNYFDPVSQPLTYPFSNSYFQEPPGFAPITPEARLFTDPDTQPDLPDGVFYFRGGSPISDKDFYWIIDTERVIIGSNDGTPQVPTSSWFSRIITDKSRGDMSIGFHQNSDADSTIDRLFIQFPNPFRDRIQAIPSSLEDEARNVTATLFYW